MARYKRMKTILVYLTNLSTRDMRQIMIEVLHSQTRSSNWKRKDLNSLCWAIGSIENILPRNEEKDFLIEVLSNLLEMCEKVPGKPNKAVVASNIMYIVGQYPRFLSDHPKYYCILNSNYLIFIHSYSEAISIYARNSSRSKRYGNFLN